MIKIAITGTESTGKTTLAQQLAVHYQTIWVEEYARIYLNTFGKNYTEKDVWKIIKGQINLEKSKELLNPKILFLDTDTTVLKIWLENSYQRCPNWFLELYQNHHYDFYLLMKPDLVWEYDELREHSELREELHQKYIQALNQKNAKYVIIEGQQKNRFDKAVFEIDSFLADF
ncbi:MAG: ATPase [Bacteroidetes bacterium]|nr:MAG: ATPase [Bacteroidota bacterium]